MMIEFKNEPLSDFARPESQQQMLEALKLVERELGKEYDLIIGGKRIRAEEQFKSCNPAEKNQVVGVFAKAGEGDARRAVEAAYETFNTSWRFPPAKARAGYLFRAAGIMRRRRFEMAAWMVYEVGKSWIEADGDVAEAIDFLEFYGREALRYDEPQPVTPYPGELNELFYIPLGVGAVIPPWNFPCAIMVGMTAAALVTGNTVILKPSSDAPTIAAKFMEVLEEAGLPAGVVNFLPGSGASCGDVLVGHPLMRFIAFTGSKEVGLHIIELAAKHQPGQIWIKRVIAEMGGKDTIIVDSEADVADAAAGVVASAFGFQGQKCSACSRVVVDATVYDHFLELLLPKVKAITVGPTRDPKNYLGPVINQKAFESILGYITIGKNEGRLLTGGAPGLAASSLAASSLASGYFLEPVVFADVAPTARIAQEEIFGPVLAVIRSRDFDGALTIANNTEYGLTGAVYSRSRSKLMKAKRLFHVGNLYFNRKCTGALVGVHPFGGFNMSGTDSKAGGRDYLLLFLQAKSVSDKM
jgi:1-pyrroline-5-carboxylate dehydrogenase